MIFSNHFETAPGGKDQHGLGPTEPAGGEGPREDGGGTGISAVLFRAD